MTRWNHQAWGSLQDPIHKSDLYGLIGKFGCLQQFKRKKQDSAAGIERQYDSASGKLCAGNAVHSVIRRVLTHQASIERIFDKRRGIAEPYLRGAFEEEFDREAAGREVNWFGRKPQPWFEECIQMLVGLMQVLPDVIGNPVAVESGFIFQLGKSWFTGSIDLIYRTKSGGLGLLDWKTSAQKPHQIELDHGWESGIYSIACKDGWILDYTDPVVLMFLSQGASHRDAMESACIHSASRLVNPDQLELLDTAGPEPSAYQLKRYPDEIYHVHLRDLVPYTRSSTKELKRPEELRWAGIDAPAKVSFKKGDQRGPAFYRVGLSESDVPRFESQVRSAVSWVRMGQFPMAPGEMCSRCRYREPCLTDGYKPRGAELRTLKRMSDAVEYDGFGDEI